MQQIQNNRINLTQGQIRLSLRLRKLGVRKGSYVCVAW